MVSLYLHIPFCRSKCHYCSFSSCAGRRDQYEAYVAALIQELVDLTPSCKLGLNSLFVGGGTPTCLPSGLLREVIRSALDLFQPQPDAEISVEANPGTVDLSYLRALQKSGVNRLSLGVQSFDDRQLRMIGRIHDQQEAGSAIKAARIAGFDNINLDLIYGLPGQSPASWRESLEMALSFFPEHLSLYQLTVEEQTPFHTLVEQKTIVLPGEDDILQMDAITGQLCGEAGLQQYETSNYATKGRECRHNINYWKNGEYLAAGASAVSCRRGVRERRLADPLEYVNRLGRNESVVIERESLSQEASFRETVIMGLRMVQGVSRKNLQTRYSLDLLQYYGATLEKLLKLGLLELTETHLRLTEKGWPLSNRIMAELV